MLTHIAINTQTFTIQHPKLREVAVHTAHPASVPWWMFQHNSGVAMAQKMQSLPSSQSILDIGCGLGLTAIVAQSLGHTVYVTDIFNECYEYVTINAETNEIAPPTWVQNINEIPSHSLDCVMLSDVLYNKELTRQTLHDVIRCIKPNGILMIAEPPRIKEAIIMKWFDIFEREYTKETVILDSIVDPSEVKDDYTTVHIYTFTI